MDQPDDKTPRRMRKCPLGKHEDRILRGGKRVQCNNCQDVFPCHHECDHFDCMLATGRPLPEWVMFDLTDAAAVVAEAMGALK